MLLESGRDTEPDESGYEAGPPHYLPVTGAPRPVRLSGGVKG